MFIDLLLWASHNAKSFYIISFIPPNNPIRETMY